MQAASEVLCGYGYRPYRLLGWIVVQLAFFCVMMNLVAHGSIFKNVYMVLVNYVNVLGVGDADGLPYSAWVLLVVEGYMGAVTTTVFFVLLVRRWFRL